MQTSNSISYVPVSALCAESRIREIALKPKMWPNLKQKFRTVLPEPKLIVYIGRSQKSFRTGPQSE